MERSWRLGEYKEEYGEVMEAGGMEGKVRRGHGGWRNIGRVWRGHGGWGNIRERMERSWRLEE